MNIIKGGVTAAKGFKAAGCEAQIKYKNGKKDIVSCVALEVKSQYFYKYIN